MTPQDRPAGGTGTEGDPAEPAYLAVMDILRCPHCRGTFVTPPAPTERTAPTAADTPTAADAEELVCSDCGRAYPVRGGVPVLLVDEARLPDGTADGAPGGARG